MALIVVPEDWLPTVAALLSVPALVAVARWVDRWPALRQPLQFLGRNTLTIYLMNSLAMGLVRAIVLKYWGWDGWHFFVVAPALLTCRLGAADTCATLGLCSLGMDRSHYAIACAAMHLAAVYAGLRDHARGIMASTSMAIGGESQRRRLRATAPAWAPSHPVNSQVVAHSRVGVGTCHASTLVTAHGRKQLLMRAAIVDAREREQVERASVPAPAVLHGPDPLALPPEERAGRTRAGRI